MPPEDDPLQPEIARVEEPQADIPRLDFEPVPPAQNQREPFWNYTDLGLVIGMLVAGMVVIILGAAAATLIWPKLQTDQTPLLLPTNLAMYLFLLLIFKLDFSSRYHRPVLPSLGWRMPEPRALVYALAAGAALPFAISGISVLLRTPKVTTKMDELISSVPIVPLVIMAAVLAPFFEELFFRGFLQPLLTRTFGVVIGVFITGAIFGGVHAVEYSFVWQYVVAISVVGWALGAMRVWANSIVPTTIMHACFNGLQVIAFAVSKHK